MSDTNEVGVSSNAELPNGPRTRSTYDRQGLNTEAPEVYQKGAEVFVVGPRGVDPNPYKIWKILDKGQYKLSRDGKSDGKVYKAGDLKGVP